MEDLDRPVIRPDPPNEGSVRRVGIRQPINESVVAARPMADRGRFTRIRGTRPLLSPGAGRRGSMRRSGVAACPAEVPSRLARAREESAGPIQETPEVPWSPALVDVALFVGIRPAYNQLTEDLAPVVDGHTVARRQPSRLPSRLQPSPTAPEPAVESVGLPRVHRGVASGWITPSCCFAHASKMAEVVRRTPASVLSSARRAQVEQVSPDMP